MSLDQNNKHGVVVNHEFVHKNGRLEKEEFEVGVSQLAGGLYALSSYYDCRTVRLSRNELIALKALLENYEVPQKPPDIQG